MKNIPEVTISWGDISPEGVLLNVGEQIIAYKKDLPCVPDYAIADCGHKYQLQKEMIIDNRLVLVKYNVFLRKPSHCHDCLPSILEKTFFSLPELLFTTKET